MIDSPRLRIGAPANGETPSEPATQNAGNSSQSTTVTATPPTWYGFQSVVHQTPSQKKAAAANFSLKVVRANLTHFEGNRPHFSKQGQTYVELTEATAKMQYVTSAVQHEWGAEYVVVTSDGLPIPDSSGTQGMLCTLSNVSSSLLLSLCRIQVVESQLPKVPYCIRGRPTSTSAQAQTSGSSAD